MDLKVLVLVVLALGIGFVASGIDINSKLNEIKDEISQTNDLPQVSSGKEILKYKNNESKIVYKGTVDSTLYTGKVFDREFSRHKIIVPSKRHDVFVRANCQLPKGDVPKAELTGYVLDKDVCRCQLPGVENVFGEKVPRDVCSEVRGSCVNSTVAETALFSCSSREIILD